MEQIIDAQGKKIGRVASQAAAYLMGKYRADFTRNTVSGVKVKIINAAKVDVTNRKLGSKTYKAYSGYPGGLKIRTMKEVVAVKGLKEVMRKAVHGMLPINKLRPQMMKNLIIEN